MFFNNNMLIKALKTDKMAVTYRFLLDTKYKKNILRLFLLSKKCRYFSAYYHFGGTP